MSAMAVKLSPSITWSTFSGQPSVSYQKWFVSRQYGSSRYPRQMLPPPPPPPPPPHTHTPKSPSPKVHGHFMRQALCIRWVNMRTLQKLAFSDRSNCDKKRAHLYGLKWTLPVLILAQTLPPTSPPNLITLHQLVLLGSKLSCVRLTIFYLV